MRFQLSAINTFLPLKIIPYLSVQVKHLLFIGLAVVVVSCRKDPGLITPVPPVLDSIDDGGTAVPYVPNLPDTLYDYENIVYPQHMLNDPILNITNNSNDGDNITNEGATLGRVLFYDKNLSANNTISCASCHHQNKAFSDGMKFSSGYLGELTGRNAMAISNVNYQRRFFWDARAATIEDQALMPIQNAVEMGMTLSNLELKLATLSYYPELFTAAFGTPEITASKIATALGMFMKSMRSFRSDYDLGVETNFADFTAEELAGKELFFSGDAKCNNCHISQNFGGTERHNNGLDAIYTDLGLAYVTDNEADIGRFKNPSLRNIELTAPYMHDGRFATLEEVLDFYSTDVNAHPNLDDRLTTTVTTGGPPIHFNFTAAQKASLIAFLKTLTDYPYITDPKYSNPFPD
ncbi:MAG: cytochrome-c peroxidase [Bacteroidetes bacterium]|nr:cytochrome-c peroxidase [Bacteroidota bacterium]